VAGVTVTDLIHSSFRLIGAIVAGETLDTEELNDAFISLNQMLASWNTEGASLVARRLVQMNVSSTNQYPLVERTVKIEAASVAISGRDCPLEIVDAQGWEAVTEKQMLSVDIKKLYCDYRYPNPTIFIWPTPRMAGTLYLWLYDTMAQFTSLTQVIDLPPGYEIALRYNFAVALLPEYPRSQVDPSLPAQAQNYKASIVQLNVSNQMRSQTGSLMQASASEAAAVAASTPIQK
jgi:hypothetical protein